MPADVFQTLRSSDTKPSNAAAETQPQPGIQAYSAPDLWNRYLAAVGRLTGFSGFQMSNLRELKDLSVSEDGRSLTIFYPQRTEFVLQPFLHGGAELKQLEESVRREFGEPRLQLRLIVEEFVGKPHAENGGLKHIYANPLVHAAEELFGASIEKIEAVPERAVLPE